MARVSFTLRRPDSGDLGSYLRYDEVVFPVRTDKDSALRADGLQTAPAVFEESFFEAVSSCYGEVDLTWAINLTAPDDVSTSPVATNIVLVYSADGEPQTIASGTILLFNSTQYALTHSGLTEGRWAYYSLFAHYESTDGDSYYERVASLAILVPKNYGSNIQLWERIPEYYRNQDISIATAEVAAGTYAVSSCIGTLPTGGLAGPLFKYLSVIGFDMDIIRTLADYTMVAQDPLLASTEALDAIASQMAVILRKSDLGGQRLRGLIGDIGYFRRSKGTLAGTEFFAQAISGSNITFDETTGEIVVFSQRANYITTPKNGSTITQSRPAFDTEIATPLPFSTDMSAYDTYDIVSTNRYTLNGTGASVDVNCVLIHMDSPVPVQLNERAVYSVQSNQGTNGIKWVRLVDVAGNQLGFEDTSTTVGGARAFEVAIETSASVGIYTDAYVEYLVDLRGGTLVNGSLLLERFFVGRYFDGDKVEGGWLIDSSSVSDYRWSGSANDSVSIFAEDYERTKSIINELLFDVIPITEVAKYTIVSYNSYVGAP